MKKPWKRGFDLIGALCLLIVLSPVLLVVWGMVRVKIGRPALFCQERPGLDGRIFKMYKFRTMTEACDEQGNLLPDELRLTKFGIALRKTSLDELPELFNIVKGDMSFVGPRPLLVRYLDRYTKEQAKRHRVRPGLTGWAQVNGRNAISWEKRFELDVWYVEHWSLRLDFKILCMTAAKVLKREGISSEGSVTMEEFMGEDRSMGKQKEINLSVPNLSGDSEDIAANLEECVQTGWVSTGGRFIGEFEKRVADYVGTQSAAAVQSGTAGLHLSLQLLGVQPGEEVIVPTLTFIAAVNPVFYVGAIPIFMDCDDTLCMDPVKLEAFCREECQLEQEGLIHQSTGRKVTAVVPVHVFGSLCDMEAIMEIAGRYRLKVLEDSTEALGSCFTEGRYKGRYGGTVGDAGVYSFNANKIITTGGGGMVVAQASDFVERVRSLSSQAKKDVLYFVHDEVGYNYRMLNLQAALGVKQIQRLEEFISVKIQNDEQYRRELKDVPGLTLLDFPKGQRTNHWFYSLYVKEETFGCSRDELMEALIREGIQCRPVWKLIHTQKHCQSEWAYRIEKAWKYEKSVLNVPCSTNLTRQDVTYVCQKIKDVRVSLSNGI